MEFLIFLFYWFTDIGFLYLLALQVLITCLLSTIKVIRQQYWIYYLILISFNFFLIINTNDWNEGSMEGSSYLIPLFKLATDAINGFILMSIFAAFIPIIIYLIFIVFLPFICNAILGNKQNTINVNKN